MLHYVAKAPPNQLLFHLGLAALPVRATAGDPHDLHHYVSADPHVAVEGTLLPFSQEMVKRPEDLDMILSAVSALTRMPLASFDQRGPARSLLVRSAVSLSTLTIPVLARELHVSTGTLKRARSRGAGHQVRQVERVLGDPRFWALGSQDLRRQAQWRRYRWHR